MKNHRKTLLDARLESQRTALKAVITQAGGSQVHLAECLGVTQAAVSKWVQRGWVPLPRAREIEALFGVPRTSVADPKVVDALSSDVLM